MKDLESTSSSSSRDEHEENNNNSHPYSGYTARVAQEVQELARTLSHSSQLQIQNNPSRRNSLVESSNHEKGSEFGLLPIDENGEFVDQRLNPDSEDFNAAYWIGNAHKLVMSDTEYFKPINIGVSYKNLRAYGNATDADYQSTF